MALESLDNGELLMNGSDQPLFSPQTGPLRHYLTKIFFDELVEGDEIHVHIEDRDKFVGTNKKYITDIIRGSQENPEYYGVFIVSESYQVFCHQVTGTLKTITWELIAI